MVSKNEVQTAMSAFSPMALLLACFVAMAVGLETALLSSSVVSDLLLSADTSCNYTVYHPCWLNILVLFVVSKRRAYLSLSSVQLATQQSTDTHGTPYL